MWRPFVYPDKGTGPESDLGSFCHHQTQLLPVRSLGDGENYQIQSDARPEQALNESIAPKTHIINLSRFAQMPLGSNIRAYHTSASENLSDASHSVRLDDKDIILDLPAQSITTLVIKFAERSNP